MILIFIDESFCREQENGKNPPGYYSIAMVAINSDKYNDLKSEYLTILNKYEWPHSMDIEFKASQLFSNTKTSEDTINSSQKIEMVERFIDKTTSKHNRKIKIYFSYRKIDKENAGRDFYIENVPIMLKKALKDGKARGSRASVKNVCAVFADDFDTSNANKKKLRKDIASAIKSTKFSFFEDIFYTKSTVYTLGLMYADLAAYILFKNKGIIPIDDRKKQVINTLGNKLQELVEKEYEKKV